MDCLFNIKRTTSSRKVIAISIWKSSPAYVFNISEGMAWWAVNTKLLFPDWNVRFYIDKDITKYMKDDIDWDSLLESLSRFSHIELWFYNCESGKKDNKHTGTFGSLVRFHALTDSSLDCRIFRNVEQLTSPKEARLIHQWVLSSKEYIVWFDIQNGYPCDYNNKKLCRDTGLEDKYMILATFGSKVTFPTYLKDSYKLCVKYDLLTYPYGVDEICLTLLLKRSLTIENTFLIPRQRLNQIFPETYTEVYETIDENKSRNTINWEISRQQDIDKLYTIISLLKKRFNDIDIDLLQKEMNDFYLNIFLNDLELSNFLETVNDKEKGVSLVLRYVIFENIDWPGGILKSKINNFFLKPEKMTLEQAEKDIIVGRKLTRRPPLSQEQLNEKALLDIERKYDEAMEKFNRNIGIFLNNIKNVYLSRDETYV